MKYYNLMVDKFSWEIKIISLLLFYSIGIWNNYNYMWVVELYFEILIIFFFGFYDYFFFILRERYYLILLFWERKGIGCRREGDNDL